VAGIDTFTELLRSLEVARGLLVWSSKAASTGRANASSSLGRAVGGRCWGL